jgi:hypothetical protein
MMENEAYERSNKRLKMGLKNIENMIISKLYIYPGYLATCNLVIL